MKTTEEFMTWFLDWSGFIQDAGPLGAGWSSQELEEARKFAEDFSEAKDKKDET